VLTGRGPIAGIDRQGDELMSDSDPRGDKRWARLWAVGQADNPAAWSYAATSFTKNPLFDPYMSPNFGKIELPPEQYDSGPPPETNRESLVRTIQIIAYVGVMWYLFGTGRLIAWYNMLGFNMSAVLALAVFAIIVYANHLYYRTYHHRLDRILVGETPEEKEERLKEEKHEKEMQKMDDEYYNADPEEWGEVDEDREEMLGGCKNYDENGVLKYD
jgi:hypothetical protein